MSQRFYGSINLTEMIEYAKKKHSAFTKSEKGDVYANVTVWVNDKEDKYGNLMSVQLNPTKENKDTEDRAYIGNMKLAVAKQVSDRDANSLPSDFDLPVQQRQSSGANPIGLPDQPATDLPF